MSHNGYCLIAGAGSPELAGDLPEGAEYIIAADGGSTLLASLGLLPDFFVGDLDSSTSSPDCKKDIHSTEKDDTDMSLALSHAMSLGYKNFVIIGGLGGERFDHTLANIQMAYAASQKNCRIIFLGGRQNMTVITAECLEFDPAEGRFISVFAIGGPAEGVSLSGLKYSVKDAVFTPDRPLGVSNEFVGEAATIGLEKGSLLVTWENTDSGFVLPKYMSALK